MSLVVSPSSKNEQACGSTGLWTYYVPGSMQGFIVDFCHKNAVTGVML